MTTYDGLDISDGTTYLTQVEDRRSPAPRRVAMFETAARPGGLYVGMPPAGRRLRLSGAVFRLTTEQALETAKDTLLNTLARPRRRLVLGPDSRFIVGTPVGLQIAPRNSYGALEWSAELAAEDAYFSAASPTGDVRTLTYGSGDLAPGETALYRIRASLTPGGSAPAPVRAILTNQAAGPTPSLWGLANRSARADHRLTMPGGVALVSTATVAAPGALVIDGERGEVWSLDLTNVIGWWPFDDASGDPVDMSGDSRDLADTGSLSYRQDILDGLHSSIHFDGSTGFLASADAGFELAADITMGAWVYPFSASANAGVMGRGDTNDGYMLRRTSGNVFEAKVGNGAAVRTATGTTAVSAFTRYFVVYRFVQSTGTVSLFVDGVLDAVTAGGAFTPAIGGNAFRVGAPHNPSGGAAEFFHGRIAQPFVLNTALTDAQIRAIHQRGGLWAIGSQVDWFGQVPSLDPQAGSTNVIEWRADHASTPPTLRSSLGWRSRYE